MADTNENEVSREEEPMPPATGVSEADKPVTFSLKKSTLKNFAIAGAALLLVAGGWLAFQSFNESQLFDRATEACSASNSRGVTVDSGGRAMYLNGEGEDSAGVNVLVQICILNELNVPESVFDRIAGTTSLMGVQTARWENLEASWTYHPKNGLDISIERK
jgi:hypothetical protein